MADTFADRVLAHLRESGFGSDLDPSSEPDDLRVVLDPPGEPWPWAVMLVLRNETQQMIFYAARPDEVPSDRLGAVVTAITLANYGLVAGNFELDLSDGELRFKIGAELEGIALDDAALGVVVDRHGAILAATLQRYLGAIEDVIDGADPTEAIDAAEQED